MAKLQITLTKSLIGRKSSHIATANALGLKKIGKTVEVEAKIGRASCRERV